MTVTLSALHPHQSLLRNQPNQVGLIGTFRLSGGYFFRQASAMGGRYCDHSYSL